MHQRKIIRNIVLHEAPRRQVEETMETLAEGPGGLLRESLGVEGGVLWGSGTYFGVLSSLSLRTLPRVGLTR